MSKSSLDNVNSVRRRYFDALKQKSVSNHSVRRYLNALKKKSASNQHGERQTKIDSINEESNLVYQ